MKKVLSVLFFIMVMSVINVPMISAEQLKIGVFDIQKVMRDSKTVDGYREKLGKEVGAKKKLFEEKQEAIRLGEEKYRKNGQKATPSERKFHEDKLSGEIKELKRLKEDIDLDLQKMDKELTQRAFREISEVVKKIAASENYTIIFEKNSSGIVHFQSSVDISDKVIREYDKR